MFMLYSQSIYSLCFLNHQYIKNDSLLQRHLLLFCHLRDPIRPESIAEKDILVDYMSAC